MWNKVEDTVKYTDDIPKFYQPFDGSEYLGV